MTIFAKLWAAAILIGICVGTATQAQDPDDVGAVRHLLMQTFDKPEAPLTAEPITVVADLENCAARRRGNLPSPLWVSTTVAACSLDARKPNGEA